MSHSVIWPVKEAHLHGLIALVRPRNRDGGRREGEGSLGSALAACAARYTRHKQGIEDEVAVLKEVLQLLQAGARVNVVLNGDRYGQSQLLPLLMHPLGNNDSRS